MANLEEVAIESPQASSTEDTFSCDSTGSLQLAIIQAFNTTDNNSRDFTEQSDKNIIFKYFQEPSVKTNEAPTFTSNIMGENLCFKNLSGSNLKKQQLWNTKGINDVKNFKTDSFENNSICYVNSIVDRRNGNELKDSNPIDTDEENSSHRQKQDLNNTDFTDREDLTLKNNIKITRINKVAKDNLTTWMSILDEVKNEVSDHISEHKSRTDHHGIEIKANQIKNDNANIFSPNFGEMINDSEQQVLISDVKDSGHPNNTDICDLKNQEFVKNDINVERSKLGPEMLTENDIFNQEVAVNESNLRNGILPITNIGDGKFKSERDTPNNVSSNLDISESIIPEFENAFVENEKCISNQLLRNEDISDNELRNMAYTMATQIWLFKKFISDWEIKNDIRNQRLQMKFNEQIKDNEQYLPDIILPTSNEEDETITPKIVDKNNTPSNLSILKNPENVTSEVENIHAKTGKNIPKLPSNHYEASYSTNNLLVENKKNQINFLNRVPDKSEYQENDIESENILEKHDQNMRKSHEKVYEHIKEDKTNNGIDEQNNNKFRYGSKIKMGAKILNNKEELLQSKSLKSGQNELHLNRSAIKKSINPSKPPNIPPRKSESACKSNYQRVQQIMPKQKKRTGNQLNSMLGSSNSTIFYSEQRVNESNSSSSSKGSKDVDSNRKIKKDSSKSDLKMSQNDLSINLIHDSLTLQNQNGKSLDQMKDFSLSEKPNSNKTCNKNCNNLTFHNHTTMIFGQCSECEATPASEKFPVPRRKLSKDPHVPYKDKRYRSKSRSVDRAKVKSTNSLKNSNRSTNKRVTFNNDYSVFTFEPNDTIIETFHYNNIEKRRQTERGSRKDAFVASKEGVATVKSDVINDESKEALPKVTEKMTSAKIRDSSKRLKEPSNVAGAATEKSDTLKKRKEYSSYDNLAFDDDWISVYSLDIELGDKSDSFANLADNDEFNERIGLIDGTVLQSTKHNKGKVKQFLDLMPTKKLSFKSMKSIIKK